jgi:pyruvate,water dikinase
MLTGNRAIAFREKELKQNTGDISEFKGTGVTKGKVRARVKVCNGVDDAFKKVKKGDILVTGMTLPDYVPVMKIASAVITNEGGITCHAAIVCRELGLPCIVGTKIATQVLKDGDLVEVDADKGVVRILK